MNQRGVQTLAMLLTTWPLVAQSPQDVLHLASGARLRGVAVIATSMASVRYLSGGQEHVVPAAQCLSIEFDRRATAADRPAARSAAGFDHARQALATAVTPAAAATAADELRAFLDQHQDHRQRPAALLLLSHALQQAGQPAAASEALDRLQQAVTGANLGLVWTTRASLAKAQLQLDQGDATTARTAFAAIAPALPASSSANEVHELQALTLQALVGQGEAMVAAGDFAAALAHFRSMAGPTASPAVRAAARCGEGHALLVQGTPGKDRQRLRAAQLALAEAAVLDADGGANAAKIDYCLGLGRRLLGEQAEANHEAHARACFVAAASTQPDNRWAALARAELLR